MRLAFTRQRDGLPLDRPVPCIRIEGEKVFLDDERIEVACECMMKVAR